MARTSHIAMRRQSSVFTRPTHLVGFHNTRSLKQLNVPILQHIILMCSDTHKYCY